MKTAKEIINDQGYYNFNHVKMFTESDILVAMELYAKQVQEAQIVICAYELSEGTIAQGGEHELIAEVERVIK